MSLFRIRALNPVQGDEREFFYDNITSKVLDADGVQISFGEPQKAFCAMPTVSKDTPGKKHGNVTRLKIQLGLSCNYECSYCNQRFMPHAEEHTNPDSIEPFLQQLPSWFTGGGSNTGKGVTLEFWGGEPFVYWKTLKPLAEKLREMYPDISFTMITNGSLLDIDKNEWLENLNFNIGLSHDGPGYHVRGEDPLDDPIKKDIILDLWRRLGPKGQMSFNAMMNKHNQSRKAVAEFLTERLGFTPPIGEGTFIDPYDQDGKAVCFDTPAEHLTYRNTALTELRDGHAQAFTTIAFKIDDFCKSLVSQRPASALGQKCGMDRADNIAVDLNGNVITCQNTSTSGIGMNGESHHIGHVSDLDAVEMKTSTHWSHREECSTCPVLQVCKGSCMFLHGDLWKTGCDASFTDNVPIFAAAFEAMTGYLPFYIDGPQQDDRKDIFGLVNGIPAPTKKPFPIPVVTG